MVIKTDLSKFKKKQKRNDAQTYVQPESKADENNLKIDFFSHRIQV